MKESALLDEISPRESQCGRDKMKSTIGIRRVPLLRALPILLGCDMFAVSLVVPLLVRYYQDAGITSAHQREWLSSLYNSAQIVGGLLLGLITDGGNIPHDTVLQVTFFGSALSYAGIAYGGGLVPLLLSRIVVGLVKHSLTVATALITVSTDKTERAAHMGRLTAAMTVVWIVGPSVGAILYRSVGPPAPAAFAAGIFLVIGFAISFLESGAVDQQETASRAKQKENASIWVNLKTLVGSRTLGLAVTAKLLSTFVVRSTSYQQLGNYYESMYGLDTHHRGFLRSFEQGLAFIVQTVFIKRAVQWAGGERKAAVMCSLVTAITLFLETQQSLPLFLLVISPLHAFSQAVLSVSLQVIVSQVAPSETVFSVFAGLDVLQNIVSVSTPFYRTVLFNWLAMQGYASQQGDPDPISWLFISCLHWILFTVIITYLLLAAWPRRTTKIKKVE